MMASFYYRDLNALSKILFCSDLSWGLFLASPDNFLGGHTSLCIFVTPRFKVIKLRNPLGFYWIKNMMKDQVFKTSRLLFDNWLLGPEKFLEFRETGPWENNETVDYFTVVCLVAWPLNESEAGVDLVLIETSLLLLCKFLLISTRTASLA